MRNRLDQLPSEKRLYLLGQLCGHLIESCQFVELKQILTNLVFIEAKCSAGLVDDVLADYDSARVVLSEEWDDESSLAGFSRFMSHGSHLLRSTSELFYQEAFNSTEQAIQQSVADLERAGRSPTGPWLRKTCGSPKQRHKGLVISLAFWGDERYLVVSTTALEVWIWDTIRGRLWRRCETPPSAAKSLVVSRDGRYLAAGFGSDVPTPFLAGVRVWTRNGRALGTYAMSEWVYTVRWRDDDELVIGAGLPHGSEASGTLWTLNLGRSVYEEIGNWLGDRPFILTWDPVPDQHNQVMALSMDGTVIHVTPDYVPITRDEAFDLSMQLMQDGDYSAHDARLAKRRPIAGRLPAPTADTFGFQIVAQIVGQNKIYMLGEPPVPPEFFAFHTPNADAIYFYDLEQGKGSQLRFSENARSAGFNAICLAVAPSNRIAVGTSYGQVFLSSFAEENLEPEILHHGGFAVTAICFSQSGKQIAVGDAGAQVTVYDMINKAVVFKTEQAQYAIAAKVDASEALVLFEDRLEIVPVTGEQIKESISLAEGFVPLDFSRSGDLVAILCCRFQRESEDLDARFIQIIDLAMGRVVLNVKLPMVLPRPDPGNSFREIRRAFEHIQLHVGRNECNVLMGSPEGVIKYPFLAFSKGESFVLPESATKRDRTITVMRVGSDLPKLSCGQFVVATDRPAIICSYADNEAHPNITGELRVWDLLTAQFSELQSFDSSVSSLAVSEDGVIVVGTEHGQVSSWRFDGKWHRLAAMRHSVAVLAVASAESTQLACSISQDGLLIVWDLVEGTQILKTFVDNEPVCVGFSDSERQLCMVDRDGEVHVWEIEQFHKVLNTTNRHEDYKVTHSSSSVLQKCLTTAVHLSNFEDLIERNELSAARSLLENLPEIPNALAVQDFWQAKLEGEA